MTLNGINVIYNIAYIWSVRIIYYLAYNMYYVVSSYYELFNIYLTSSSYIY